MKQRYSVLLISIILLVIIVVLECFTEDEDKIQTLPVNNVLNFSFEDSDTKININLNEINSKNKCAKNINKEISNIFLSRAKNIIDNYESYVGVYQIVTEYSLNDGMLSLKIYENDSNEDGTSGNIYACVYDTKNDMELNLSGVCDYLNLDYNVVINEAKTYAYEKNKYINCEVPYFYINSNNNLELILRSIIQVEKYSFWNNIEIYEVIDDKIDK